MAISRDHKNVFVLAICQALFMTGQSMLIILSGLVGAAIAEDKALATLPVSTVVIATMLTTVPASLLMKRVGRRAGFMVFGTVAMASLTSGAILHFLDWQAVNIAAIAPITIAMIASLWLAMKRRAARAIKMEPST